jgi:hypothetical protein
VGQAGQRCVLWVGCVDLLRVSSGLCCVAAVAALGWQHCGVGGRVDTVGANRAVAACTVAHSTT